MATLREVAGMASGPVAYPYVVAAKKHGYHEMDTFFLERMGVKHTCALLERKMMDGVTVREADPGRRSLHVTTTQEMYVGEVVLLSPRRITTPAVMYDDLYPIGPVVNEGDTIDVLGDNSLRVDRKNTSDGLSAFFEVLGIGRIACDVYLHDFNVEMYRTVNDGDFGVIPASVERVIAGKRRRYVVFANPLEDTYSHNSFFGVSLP